ncbi:MAG TPA: tyrosine-type recombinase/integrase [Phycisphaerae bacterium]|nr:tyrosine-type recombinase/integrase [Phycisphaerae bacterium]
MFVFRNTYKDATGATREAGKWTVCFADHQGIRRRLPAFASKKESQSLGRTLERLASAKLGGESLPVELQRWIESLPQDLRERLGTWRLLDAQRIAAGKTLKQHLADWQAYLLGKDNTPKYVALITGRAERIIVGCKLTYLSDVSAARVVAHLAELRDAGISAQTSNFYLKAITGFIRWMCQDGRASANPLEYISGLNARTDRRHDRRALDAEEIRWLLTTTAAAPPIHGMPGPIRGLCYRLAVESGLRSAELASLTRESFNFAADPPTVTVRACYSKHRREDTLPLRPDTAAQLRDVAATTFPGLPVFKMPLQTCHMSKLLKADLAAARTAWLADAPTPEERKAREERTDFLAYVDAAGRFVDFHSLRHTCGSLLAAAQVHPKTAQLIMRHSDINLTLARYTHGYAGDEAAALAKLPDFGRVETAGATAAKTTG